MLEQGSSNPKFSTRINIKYILLLNKTNLGSSFDQMVTRIFNGKPELLSTPNI